MNQIVGAQHEFHDADYAHEWSKRNVPTPERLQLFNTLFERLLSTQLPAQHVIELGIGPAYLAAQLLERIPGVTYEGVDFSEPMLQLAQKRLQPHAFRVRLTRADLVHEDWTAKVAKPVGAVISTWALHDLGGEEQTRQVYQACRHLLAPGGMLLNGDFVKPDGAIQDYEPGRFSVARHLEILHSVGFREARCLVLWEKELENPTSAQNYACFEAIV